MTNKYGIVCTKLFVAGILCACIYPKTVFAQSTVNIGNSSFSGENFACRTYPGGEDIIISRKGKSRTVAKKAGAAVAKKSIKILGSKIKVLKKTVAEKKGDVNKLKKSQSLFKPGVQRKIDQLNNQIAKLNIKLSFWAAQKSELQAIIKLIIQCGKAPTIEVGQNATATKLFTLPISGERYYMVAYHAFTFAGVIPPEICARIDGKITNIKHTKRFCCIGNDGPGYSNHFAECIDVALGPNSAAFGLGGACDGFSSGRYEDDLEEVSKASSKAVEVFLPNKQGSCQ